jgi:hypothetical protein
MSSREYKIRPSGDMWLVYPTDHIDNRRWYFNWRYEAIDWIGYLHNHQL